MTYDLYEVLPEKTDASSSSSDEPLNYIIFERYLTKADFDKHCASDLFVNTYLPLVKKLSVAHPRVIFYEETQKGFWTK